MATQRPKRAAANIDPPADRARGAQPGNGNAAKTGIYSAHFSDDELQRILAGITDPASGVTAALEATYVLLDRIIARVSQDPQTDPEIFLSLVKAHNETTGRIASLLRSHQVISGDAADTLTGHIAAALDQLAEQMQVTL
jgi:hypothetical protein